MAVLAYNSIASFANLPFSSGLYSNITTHISRNLIEDEAFPGIIFKPECVDELHFYHPTVIIKDMVGRNENAIRNGFLNRLVIMYVQNISDPAVNVTLSSILKPPYHSRMHYAALLKCIFNEHIYYVNRGIILDSEFNPLLISYAKSPINQFARSGEFDAFYVNKDIFTKTSDPMCKVILNKFIPSFVAYNLPFHFVDSSLGETFPLVVTGNNMASLNDNTINEYLSNNIETVMRTFDTLSQSHLN